MEENVNLIVCNFLDMSKFEINKYIPCYPFGMWATKKKFLKK